jgi:multidrug efflux pump subunit AcrA (membrane-fusion protein)
MSSRGDQGLFSNRPHRSLLTVWLLFCAIALFSSTGFAQAASTGALNGSVTDPSGAVVPGVNIKVTNEATGETRAVTSNSDGIYLVPLLAAGTGLKPEFKASKL